jgi:predicted nucleotidyltransferase
VSVRPEEAVLRLRARYEHPSSEDLAATRTALGLLPRLAAGLREVGAGRVILFGSLALGTFHAGSDIDLAVGGLTERELARLERELSTLAGIAVELVNLDIASPGIRRHIDRRGREL